MFSKPAAPGKLPTGKRVVDAVSLRRDRKKKKRAKGK